MIIGNCLWCAEPVDDEQPHTMQMKFTGLTACDRAQKLNLAPIHEACTVRVTKGSVAHQQEKCACYGGTESDPPGMSKRLAAYEAEREAMFQEGPGHW